MGCRPRLFQCTFNGHQSSSARVCLLEEAPLRNLSVPTDAICNLLPLCGGLGHDLSRRLAARPCGTQITIKGVIVLRYAFELHVWYLAGHGFTIGIHGFFPVGSPDKRVRNVGNAEGIPKTRLL